MEKVKFDEFYFKDENKILDINIIKEYARENDGNTKKKKIHFIHYNY